MDLSHSLTVLTCSLLKDIKQGVKANIKVYVHPPSENTLGRFLVAIDLRSEDNRWGGSGASFYLHEAYSKALCEFGENQILKKSDYDSRCGMAGGLFRSQAVERAKNELLERDAFLFHYGSQIPFEFVGAEEGFFYFKMIVADPAVSGFFVTDSACVFEKAECLLFGTGAHRDSAIALEKAKQEYASLFLNHKRQPERCKWLAENANQVNSVMDQHHLASRDPRNIKKMGSLCRNYCHNVHNQKETSKKSIRNFQPQRWRIEDLNSPICMMKFVRADHPDLIKMMFGIPEKLDATHTPILLHPFW